MNKFFITVKYTVPVIAAIILLCGCVALIERAGFFLDGSELAETTISRYNAYKLYGAASDIEIEFVENRMFEKSIIITVKAFPMVKLRGTQPESDGTFYFTTLEYVSGNTYGWNEYTSQLYGSGRIVLREISTMEITEQLVQVQITGGRIHRYDTRITGNEAFLSMRNRYDRITTLTQWMLTLDGLKGRTIKEFERYWKPILFPEMAANRDRPEGWQLPDDVFQTAEDIKWNINYTERVFPPELFAVRNSGTLLRDWEEALSLVYLEYEWENLQNIFSNKIILYKVK